MRGTRSTCPTFRTLRFSPLPATGREVDEIAALWQGSATGAARSAPVTRLTGDSASKTLLFKLAPGHAVLHLATHGFFLGGNCSATPGERGIGGLEPAGTPPPQDQPTEDPLMLSGLAWAGANRRAAIAPDADDGILTAEEVAALDLNGLEWAVLSACDTGVGALTGAAGLAV